MASPEACGCASGFRYALGSFLVSGSACERRVSGTRGRTRTLGCETAQEEFPRGGPFYGPRRADRAFGGDSGPRIQIRWPSGEGTVSIAGTEYPVRAGSAIFVPGNTWHGAFNTGSDLLRLLYVFPTSSFDKVHYQFPAE